MPVKCDQLCFGEEARNGRIDRAGPLRVKISGNAKTDEQCRAIPGKAVCEHPFNAIATARRKHTDRDAAWICVCHGLIQAPPNSSSSSLLANGLEKPRPPTRLRA